jgi:hypothetical protein
MTASTSPEMVRIAELYAMAVNPHVWRLDIPDVERAALIVDLTEAWEWQRRAVEMGRLVEQVFR